MDRRDLTVALAVAVLIAANFTVDVALLVWALESGNSSAFLNQFALGVLVGQVFCVGIWLGLGEVRWYWRMVVAIPLTLATAQTIGVATSLSPEGRRQDGVAESLILGFIFLVLMLGAVLLLLPVRQLFNWRLTTRPASDIQPIGQYRAGDLLLWMVPFGGFMAAIRFVVSLDKNFKSISLQDLGSALGLFIVVFTAMAAVSARRRRGRAYVLFALAVLGTGFAFVGPSFYAALNAAINWRVISNAWNDVTDEIARILGTVVIALTNFICLRLLGCRLVRPGENGETRPVHT